MAPPRTDLAALAQAYYLDEMNDHLTYQALARHARAPELRRTLERIAAMERGHARFWEGVLRDLGCEVRPPRPRRGRLFVLRQLQRLVNPVLLVAALELGETEAVSGYYRVWKDGGLDERRRASLRAILLDELEHEVTFRREAQRLGLGNVRDFVLGMNDGLVEILGAVTGLSAAYPGSPLVVAVSGLIVGVAGAMSMGIGAYISVRSQRQVNEGARRRNDIVFDVAPERAARELRDRLTDSGVPAEVADRVSETLSREPDALRRLLGRTVEENELRSALFTGAAYLLGVVFPVSPYFLAHSSFGALGWSVTLAATALAAVGGVVAVVSGIRLRTKVAEMVVSGLAAAVLAYGFGRLMQGLFGIGP